MVDAFPKETFEGVVSQVRMNATVVQNVVTYDTIVDFDNASLRLFPGMTAYVTIPIATATGVLKVPNAGLRYRPPVTLDEIGALYRKYGVEDAGSAPRATAATAVVWKIRDDGSLEPVQIVLGITDHSYTELKGTRRGELREGEEIVTGSVGGPSGGPPLPGGQRR